jgi:hypothetical protein
MNRLILSLAAALAATLAAPLLPVPGASTGLAAARISEPEAVIRAIYEQYSREDTPSDAEARNFSPALLKAWNDVEDAADAANEVGVDFDVFLDAEDTDVVTNIATTFTPRGADKGIVDIKFTAFDAEDEIKYAMVKTSEGWKIDNIDWGPDRDDLRKTLALIRADQQKPQ